MESFTYGGILDLATGFARMLEARGIIKGERVMLWGENSAQWIASFFGCVLAGVIVVPIDDEHMKFWIGAEAIAEDVGLGGDDGVGLALVLGERADEAQDQRGVGGLGIADGKHGE